MRFGFHKARAHAIDPQRGKFDCQNPAERFRCAVNERHCGGAAINLLAGNSTCKDDTTRLINLAMGHLNKPILSPELCFKSALLKQSSGDSIGLFRWPIAKLIRRVVSSLQVELPARRFIAAPPQWRSLTAQRNRSAGFWQSNLPRCGSIA